MRCLFMLVGLLGMRVEAYAPIQWMKFPSRVPVVMPKGFDGYGRWFADLSPPQRLTLGDAPDNMSPNMVPYFSAMPDKTIAWDDMQWCIEAGGAKPGDAVNVNRCTGGPDQQWNWISDSHGRSMVQLVDTNMCMDVTNKEGSLKGSDIVLQECASKPSESWKFDEPPPLPTPPPDSFALDWLHVSPFQVAIWSSAALIGILLAGTQWLAKQRSSRFSAQEDTQINGNQEGVLLVAGARNAPQRTSTVMASAAGDKEATESRVKDLDTIQGFKDAIKAESLVIVDFSNTWCGPCKLMEPKFDAMSIKYPNVTFYKALQDKNLEMKVVMALQSIKILPSFGLFKLGKQVAMVPGARPDELTAAIEEHM